MKRILGSILVLSLLFTWWAAAAQEPPSERPTRKRKAAVVEYCERASKLSPRDADGYFQLGQWCRERGLEKEALRCFEEAIVIDADHGGARAALGYSRYGADWKRLREGEKVALPPRTLEPAKPPASSDVPGAGGPSAKTGTDSGRPEEPAAGPSPTTPTAESLADPELEKKKAWAAKASDDFRTPFATYEDKDFLVHTTYPSERHPQLKALVALLRQSKQDLVRLLGLRRNLTLWPSKLQFVLLRYEEEYKRFGEAIDGVEVRDSTYTRGTHTVLWKPEGKAAARRVGETALESLQGSDRWVGWWLREGLAEMLAAQSTEGQEDQHYRRCFAYAEDRISSKGDDLKIFFLLETPSYRERDRSRNQALALTLVDFLCRLKPRSFQKLVSTLKSFEAPAVPQTESDEDFRAYYSDYVAFQRETIESLYRTELLALDAKWKEYVRAQTERLEPKSP